MFKVFSKNVVVSLSVVVLALGVVLLPVIARAAEEGFSLAATEPAAFLEYSKIIALGNKIKVLRMPKLDSSGKTFYWDLDILLTVPDTGAPKAAKITAKKSPNPEALGFIPGTYSDGKGGSCTMGISTVAGGRTAGALACRDKDGSAIFNANWVTGPVAGHPFEAYLVAAGIDKISGATNVAWGNGNSAIGNWAYGCFDQYGNVISVHQAGSVLAINNYDYDNIINCSYSFTLEQ